MMNLTDIGKQIKSTTQALAKADAELKWELAASAADVAGLVDPTPASDLVGAGLAIRKGDWLGAGMSVVSMVPYLGDAIAKPAKGVRAAKRINELRQTVTKLSAKLNDLRKAEKEAQAAETAAKEARIAKEAAEAKAAKEAADGQKAGAKGGKDKDCEDCSANGSGKPVSKAVPQTKVPCFHPFDKVKFKRLGAEDQKKYLKEMSRQLSRQQDAINDLSANEFKAARTAFHTNNRNPFAAGAQASAREDFEESIRDSVYESLRKRKISVLAARTQAKERAAAVMEKLAALHDPDMVAGGWMHPSPTGMGRRDVNSSIGGSWNQNGRVAALDQAAEDAVRSGNGDAKMNIKLEPCRGKGIR
jgi:hypothetical protein